MMWWTNSIRSLLNPELTASWEKGLDLCGERSRLHPKNICRKLDHFIVSRIDGVKGLNNQYQLKRAVIRKQQSFYKKNDRQTIWKGEEKMKGLTVKELYTLEETIAKKIFDGVTYPWEVLAEDRMILSWNWGKH